MEHLLFRDKTGGLVSSPNPSYATVVSAPTPSSAIQAAHVCPLDATLKAVLPRKSIFVSRLLPDTTSDNIKSYLAVKTPSIDLKRVSIFKLSSSQSRAIYYTKINDRLDRIGDEVLIALSSTVQGFLIGSITTDEVEFIAIRFKLAKTQCYVTCSYIPPNVDTSIYMSHTSLIRRIVELSNPIDTIIVLGDFNRPHITWNYCEDSRCMLPSTDSDKGRLFLNELFDCNLSQYSRTANSCARLLDLCFANDPEIQVTRCHPFSLPKDPYHPALCISLQSGFDGPVFNPIDIISSSSKSSQYLFEFKKMDISLLKSRLSHIKLDCSSGNIDTLTSAFYNELRMAISLSVPIRLQRPRDKSPPWFNGLLKYFKNMKNRFF
uniref:Endo/exonuclease/phosphatase domain-containing protein n=1 Tax=Glossina brevipalpis TaxID=37001 RepID=A0A1A9WPF1_9MUSC